VCQLSLISEDTRIGPHHLGESAVGIGTCISIRSVWNFCTPQRLFGAIAGGAMKLFNCQHCDQLLYFENTLCERCGHRLGYIPDSVKLSALEPDSGNWRALAGGKSYRFCANAQYDVCNWLVGADESDIYCLACRHNRTVPDTSIQDNVVAWRKIEAAKHRLFYTIMALRLPTEPGNSGGQRLAFEFLASSPQLDGSKVMTGHNGGVITLALEEAHDAQREAIRTSMREPYRTLLGHFRHEIGHYYWDVLVRDNESLEECRNVFGDDSLDYGQALQSYYQYGPTFDWQNRFVSAYASAHPWEDFAETWAHYLHIVDTLEMARAFGLYVNPPVAKRGDLEAEVDFDPYLVSDVSLLIDTWIPLSNALNSLNRTLGQPDIYPFVLSPPVTKKLGFIHALISRNKQETLKAS
jgi:hypothetical protein